MQFFTVSSALLLAALALPVAAQTNNQPSMPANNTNQGMGQQGMPPGGPGGRHHGPPPEAVAACNGKAAGASCQFVDREGLNLSGSCFQPPAGGPNQGQGSGNGAQSAEPPKPIACRPDRPRGGGGNMGNQMGGGQPR